MKICILGIELSSPNKGCCALGYSFLYMLKKIFIDLGIKEVNYYVIARNSVIYQDILDDFPTLEIVDLKIKDPKFICTFIKIIKKSDYVFDFSEGDSFSDIYGKKRFIINSFLKQLAIFCRTPFIMGPQTYGPFYSKICKIWAKSIINNSNFVFSRDEISTEFIKNLTGKKVYDTTDIAFSLPYFESKRTPDDRVKIGINISGLLWNGGYTRDNQFGLKFDYKKYIIQIIDKIIDQTNYEIHLISHVSDTDSNNIELDNFACEEVKRLYPNILVAPYYQSPIYVKSYISTMDFFIGARMHSTIASFSAKVPTLPFAYSRKFKGLFDKFGYSYVIDATIMDIESAVDITMDYIEKRKSIKEELEEDCILVNKLINDLEKEFKKIICNYKN